MLDMASFGPGSHVKEDGKVATMLPPPLPDQPGPFSLGGDGVLEEAFRKAGCKNVEAKVIDVPLCVPIAIECLNFEKESVGALNQMLSGLADAEKEEAWAEIEVEQQKFQTNDGLSGPCEFVIAVGTKQ